MKTRFALTVNQENANKSYNDVIFHQSDWHIHRLASSGLWGSGLLPCAERRAHGSWGQNDLTPDSQRPEVLKCPGNVGHLWDIALNIREAPDPPRTRDLSKALAMKVKDQRSPGDTK